MTVPPIDISPGNWQIVQDILQKHVPNHEVWAFGSRARRTARTYSDLDLTIVTDGPLPLLVRADIIEDFSESDLPFRVDLLDWHTAQESFRRIVEKNKVVIRPGTRSQQQ